MKLMSYWLDTAPAFSGDFEWPAIPGHFGRPWFLPLVGAYYRLQDRLT